MKTHSKCYEIQTGKYIRNNHLVGEKVYFVNNIYLPMNNVKVGTIIGIKSFDDVLTIKYAVIQCEQSKRLYYRSRMQYVPVESSEVLQGEVVEAV